MIKQLFTLFGLSKANLETQVAEVEQFLAAGQCESALKKTNRLIQSNQDDFRLWFLKGKTLFNITKLPEALDVNGKTVPAFARGLFNRGKLIEAVEALEVALSINPQDVRTLCLMGTVKSNLNNISDAEKLFQKAHEIDRQDAEPILGMGICCAKNGKDSEAIKCFDSALALNPSDRKILVALFVCKALSLSVLNKNEGAIEVLNLALIRFPDDVWASQAMDAIKKAKLEQLKRAV
jgi:tetratricopeptide (TPR) repeat protein